MAPLAPPLGCCIRRQLGSLAYRGEGRQHTAACLHQVLEQQEQEQNGFEEPPLQATAELRTKLRHTILLRTGLQDQRQ